MIEKNDDWKRKTSLTLINRYKFAYNDASPTAGDICRQTVGEKSMLGTHVNIRWYLRELPYSLPERPDDIMSSQLEKTGCCCCLNPNQTQ
jgi:hypothetical protein